MNFVFFISLCVATCWCGSFPNQITTNCRVVEVTSHGGVSISNSADCANIRHDTWDPHEQIMRPMIGACRWDEVAGSHGDKGQGCLCPADADTCTANGRSACYWHKDESLGTTSCVSKAERFYYEMSSLLAERGKKDFSLRIRYGSVPAKGKLPFGLRGPAVFGMGARQPGFPLWMMMRKNPLFFLMSRLMGFGMRGFGGGMGAYGVGMGGQGGYGQPMGGQGGYGQPYATRGGGLPSPYGTQPISYGPQAGVQPGVVSPAPPVQGSAPPSFGGSPAAGFGGGEGVGAQTQNPGQLQQPVYSTSSNMVTRNFNGMK